MYTPDVFSACLPVFTTDIKRCGTVTICDAKPLEPDQMDDVFMESGDYRVMGALLRHDVEIKMCTKVENGLYELLMSNKVNMEHKVRFDDTTSPGLLRVRPFIIGRRQNPINNNWWSVHNGTLLSGGNYSYDLTSLTNMPIDVAWFNPGEREFMEGMNGDTPTKTAWTVVSSTAATATIDGVADTPVIRVVMSQMNAGSYLPAAWRVPPTGTSGVSIGRIERGTANVEDVESWCEQPPGVIPYTEQPFWVERTRDSLCTSQHYEEWRDLLMDQNLLFKKWGTLTEITYNAQAGLDWRKRFLNTAFNGAALNESQRIGTYKSLPTYETAVSTVLNVTGAECEGYRANAIGYVEQLAECGRIAYRDGDTLNLWSLWLEMEQIIRVREGSGDGRTIQSVDVFTDSQTAGKIQLAMMNYYKTESASQFVMSMPVNADQNLKTAHFGFKYRQYTINRPFPLVMNVIIHRYFDDNYANAVANGTANEGMGRNLWIIDFADFDIGILETNEVTNETGNLKAMAAVDDTYRCVMKVKTRTTKLMSMQWTVMVECPKGHLLIKGFSSAIPSVVEDAAVHYPDPADYA